jgi:hypothetical protein
MRACALGRLATMCSNAVLPVGYQSMLDVLGRQPRAFLWAVMEYGPTVRGRGGHLPHHQRRRMARIHQPHQARHRRPVGTLTSRGPRSEAGGNPACAANSNQVVEIGSGGTRTSNNGTSGRLGRIVVTLRQPTAGRPGRHVCSRVYEQLGMLLGAGAISMRLEGIAGGDCVGIRVTMYEGDRFPQPSGTRAS